MTPDPDRAVRTPLVDITYGAICPHCEVETMVTMREVKRPDKCPPDVTVPCANCEVPGLVLVKDYQPNAEYEDD